MDNNSSISFNYCYIRNYMCLYPTYFSSMNFKFLRIHRRFTYFFTQVYNIFLNYYHFVAFTKIREIFVTLFIISVLLKIFHERMIKDSVKNDDEGGISTCALLQIFPAPFTETRYPRFIFGPPYRSQRRPATCCSILSPACWALPFC